MILPPTFGGSGLKRHPRLPPSISRQPFSRRHCGGSGLKLRCSTSTSRSDRILPPTFGGSGLKRLNGRSSWIRNQILPPTLRRERIETVCFACKLETTESILPPTLRRERIETCRVPLSSYQAQAFSRRHCGGSGLKPEPMIGSYRRQRHILPPTFGGSGLKRKSIAANRSTPPFSRRHSAGAD